MSRHPEIILKTDERKVILELEKDGKFAAKSTGWDENRVFLEGRQTRGGGRPWPLSADPSARWAETAAASLRALLPDRLSNTVTARRCAV
jgi:hypothetical protein